MENQNHVHSFVDTLVPATCTQQGYTLHRCACGYEYKDRFVPVGAHSFEVLEQTEPTCTDPGSQSLRCTLCDLSQMRPIPPKGHTWGKWNLLTVPTCLEPGSKNRVCTCCGYEDVHPIQPTGHRLTSPQKGKRGKIAYFCENCGQTDRPCSTADYLCRESYDGIGHPCDRSYRKQRTSIPIFLFSRMQAWIS
jgi:hypothetical protein